MTRLKVIYVDDEPDIREIAVMALQLDPDIEVRAAESGRAALDMLEDQGWIADIVVLDLMMPGLDGVSVLTALRALPWYAETPVVFVTARTTTSDMERLKERGARGVVTKPFDPLTFAQNLRRLAIQ